MSLNLDPRQRAMLREMGVRVWQPQHARQSTDPAQLLHPNTASGTAAPVSVAIDKVGATPEFERARGRFDVESPAAPALVVAPSRSAPAAGLAKTQVSRTAPAAVSPAASTGAQHMPWGAGRAQQLYAPTGADSEPARTGARWLVLAEVDTEALQAAVAQPAPAFNPFAGDAGRLLDNMLRAAGLNQALSVHLVPLARHWQAPPHVPAQTSAADAPVQLLDDLAVAMSGWAETLAPDVVLVMGRFAAQALLPTELPFGKLRGQVHALYGTPVVVTYDAGCLLRYQADKAKAWDDLRLAMGVARQAAG